LGGGLRGILSENKDGYENGCITKEYLSDKNDPKTYTRFMETLITKKAYNLRKI